MICAWSSYESNTEFDVAADGRPLGETSVGEGYAEKVAYTYDAQGRIAKQVTQEVNMDYSTDPVTCTSVGDPITLTFTYSDIDANGNWTIRKDSERGCYKARNRILLSRQAGIYFEPVSTQTTSFCGAVRATTLPAFTRVAWPINSPVRGSSHRNRRLPRSPLRSSDS